MKLTSEFCREWNHGLILKVLLHKEKDGDECPAAPLNLTNQQPATQKAQSIKSIQMNFSNHMSQINVYSILCDVNCIHHTVGIVKTLHSPANRRSSLNAGLMLGQSRRRWANIKPALDEHLSCVCWEFSYDKLVYSFVGTTVFTIIFYLPCINLCVPGM